jgi:DNA-binding NarL/FixJ family response regulator
MIDDQASQETTDVTRGESARRRDHRLRALVIHEHRLFREALAVALSTQHATVTVIDCLSSVTALLADGRHNRLSIDVLLLGGPKGLAELGRQGPLLRRHFPNATVLVMGGQMRTTHLWRDGSGGVAIARVVTHEGSLNGLLRSLQALRRDLGGGRTTAAISGVDRMNSQIIPPRADLTTREQEILELRRSGLSQKEIAALLRIGVQTVKNHVHTLSIKLHLTRQRAVALAASQHASAVSGDTP